MLIFLLKRCLLGIWRTVTVSVCCGGIFWLVFFLLFGVASLSPNWSGAVATLKTSVNDILGILPPLLQHFLKPESLLLSIRLAALMSGVVGVVVLLTYVISIPVEFVIFVYQMTRGISHQTGQLGLSAMGGTPRPGQLIARDEAVLKSADGILRLAGLKGRFGELILTNKQLLFLSADAGEKAGRKKLIEFFTKPAPPSPEMGETFAVEELTDVTTKLGLFFTSLKIEAKDSRTATFLTTDCREWASLLSNLRVNKPATTTPGSGAWRFDP